VEPDNFAAALLEQMSTRRTEARPGRTLRP